MAILNETAVMTEVNPFMIVLGAILIAGSVGISLAVLRSNCGFVTSTLWVVLALVLVFIGSFLVRYCDDPDFQVTTNKKYIEATFAKGSPTAAILEKYDVIGREGKVWHLVTKDGVKDEKRPKVTIYEGVVE